MKTIECSRCHKLFRSTEERIYIHTRTQDYNWCADCTRQALQMMKIDLRMEDKKLNFECMKCPLKKGCLITCAVQAEDVIELMLAGATAVEVGAANLVDPFACKRIIEDLPAVMKKYRIEKLTDIIGGAH